MSGFNVARAMGGLLAEKGRQENDAAKRYQDLEDKRMEEDRENRRMEAQLIKQQALSKYNFDLSRRGQVVGRTQDGLIATQADVEEGKGVVSEEQYKSTVPMSEQDQAEHESRMGLLGLQMENARTAGRAKEDRRGAVGKDYDDLAQIYGPEEAAKMIGKKYNKAEVSDYQRVQALDKIQQLIDTSGGVTDGNAGQINAMLRSIGEPPYQRVEDAPGKKGLFKDTPATYRWAPGEAKDDGDKENNFGNIRPKGASSGFNGYESGEEGIKAIDDNLKAYGEKYKINTLSKVMSRWSPPNENDTASIIDSVSKMTGLKPDQEIDLGNPAVRTVIAAAIIRQEGSQGYKRGIDQNKNAPVVGEEVQSSKKTSKDNVDNAPEKRPGKGLLKTVADSKVMSGSVDAGEMIGKPIAAAGEMMGDTVTAAIDLIQKATKQRVTDADIAQIKAYAKEINDPEKVAKAYLNLAGSPSKNTEQYMQRTSSKDLNQYFR